MMRSDAGQRIELRRKLSTIACSASQRERDCRYNGLLRIDCNIDIQGVPDRFSMAGRFDNRRSIVKVPMSVQASLHASL